MPSDDRLSRAERELFLRSFIRDGISASSAAVRAISDAMTETHYPAGAMLYQRGSMPRFMYYLVSGRVRLTAEGLAPLEYERLSTIGGLDALQDIPYTRTAVALEDTRALLLPASKYLQVLEDNVEFAKRMVTFLVGQLDAAGAQLPMATLYGHEPGALPDGSSDRRLGLLERMWAVQRSPLFGALRSQVLVGLAERMEERTLEAGAPLFTSSAERASFWLVADGAVRATRQADGATHDFGAGNVVLLYAAFAEMESRYRVAAEQRSRMLLLRKDDFFDLLEDHGDVARVALGYAASRRTRLLNALADQGLQAPPVSAFNVGRR